MTATGHADLLEMARTAPDELAARWSFVDHPKIASILRREVRRFVRTEDQRADLTSEARVAIVEALARPRTFSSEGELVSYWNLRVRGIVESARRRTGGCVFRDGRIVQVEYPAGDDIFGDRLEEPAHPHLLADTSTNRSRHAGTDRTLKEHRQQQAEAERQRMIELARDYLFHYDSHQAASCFWYRVQGASWTDIPGLVGLPDGPKGREQAALLYHRFVADARSHFIERGERVTVTILGLHADEMSVSAVLLADREVLEAWTAEYVVLGDWDVIERGLRGLFSRGANFVATTMLPNCDTGVLVRTLCARRGIEVEEFDVELLKRGLPVNALEGTDLEPGQRDAYIAARAKAVECDLKMDAYV